MANTISIDQLANEIAKAVKTYTDDVIEGVSKVVDKVADEVLGETKQKSPGTGKYASGFVKTKRKGQKGFNGYYIWNKKHYRLVHLLEYGHAKRGGGRVRAYPHMIPAYDNHIGKLEESIKRVIENGGEV